MSIIECFQGSDLSQHALHLCFTDAELASLESIDWMPAISLMMSVTASVAQTTSNYLGAGDEMNAVLLEVVFHIAILRVIPT